MQEEKKKNKTLRVFFSPTAPSPEGHINYHKAEKTMGKFYWIFLSLKGEKILLFFLVMKKIE